MPSNPELYADLTPQQLAEIDKQCVTVRYASEHTFRAVCRAPWCGAPTFGWCSNETSDPDVAELWAQIHTFTEHWTPLSDPLPRLRSADIH